MSLAREPSLSWVKRVCIKVVRMGHIPNHVAFIMDGNRWYAEKHKLKKIQGHTQGFEELIDTLEWCRELGIHELTVYAFSIENFKRSPEEVAALMELARQKFQCLLDETENYKKHGIRVQVIGQISLLSVETRKLITESMKATENNKPFTLNIAFPYTGREEITQAVSAIVTGVANGAVSADDVTEDLISNCLYTSPSRHPDLLIRTSGEVRLSDFLTWQTSFTCILHSNALARVWVLGHATCGPALSTVIRTPSCVPRRALFDSRSEQNVCIYCQREGVQSASFFLDENRRLELQ